MLEGEASQLLLCEVTFGRKQQELLQQVETKQRGCRIFLAGRIPNNRCLEVREKSPRSYKCGLGNITCRRNQIHIKADDDPLRFMMSMGGTELVGTFFML